jgi:hypothetical protein
VYKCCGTSLKGKVFDNLVWILPITTVYSSYIIPDLIPPIFSVFLHHLLFPSQQNKKNFHNFKRENLSEVQMFAQNGFSGSIDASLDLCDSTRYL